MAVEGELTQSDRLVNLVDEGIDAVMRIGVLSDSSLVGRTVGQTRRVVVVSPAYLAPSDLVDVIAAIWISTATAFLVAMPFVSVLVLYLRLRTAIALAVGLIAFEAAVVAGPKHSCSRDVSLQFPAKAAK